MPTMKAVARLKRLEEMHPAPVVCQNTEYHSAHIPIRIVYVGEEDNCPSPEWKPCKCSLCKSGRPVGINIIFSRDVVEDEPGNE